MDIITAERETARFVAAKLSRELDMEVFRGAMPEGVSGVEVRFERGRTGADDLAEFVAAVRGVFDEPDGALAFAQSLWGTLPEYGAGGFAVVSGEGDLEFAEEAGRFSARGKLRVVFAAGVC